ncbi:MAG: site-2 protease family protein [Candidatus Omnitrophica bacterium]|nr:site-2 protease family protein [Candidatus Omnitrophota bacterium]
MLTAIIVIVVFSLLILVHELGHLFAAKKLGVSVEVFSLGMGKRLFGIKMGGTDYRLSLFPFGGYCKMAGEEPGEAKGASDELFAKPVGHRFWIMASGSLTNYLFAFLLFSVIFVIGAPNPISPNKVGGLLNNYPAEEAGIRVGDIVTSIDDIRTETWEDVLKAINKGVPQNGLLKITVTREKESLTFNLRPKLSDVKGPGGKIESRAVIGISPAIDFLPGVNPVKAVYRGGKHLLGLTLLTYKMFWLLLTGAIPVKESLSGPIGIAYFIGKMADLGMVPLLIITAHISMALAIFNLLPFPVLDGGHILFLALEKLRGKPLSLKAQEAIANVAVFILIAFAVFVSFQDVKKFTPLGKLGMKHGEAATPMSNTPAK